MSQPQPNTPAIYPSDRKMTVLEVLYQVYNEQLDQLVRTQTDFKLFERLALREPDNKEHVARRTNLRKGLDIKEDLIDILAKRIDEEERKVPNKKEA